MRNFTTREGIPSQEVYHVYQDKKGYIWICTDAGLAKYNANTFKLFNSSNGMPDNTIFEVKEDRHGRVWFRTITGKTGYISNDSVHQIEANETITTFYNEGLTGSFTIDEKDRVIFGRQSSAEVAYLQISPPYRNSDAKKIWTDTARHCGVNIIKMNNGDLVYSERRSLCNNSLFTIKIYNEAHQLLVNDSTSFSSPLLRVGYKNNNLFLALDSNLIIFNLKEKKSWSRNLHGFIVSVIPQDSGFWAGVRNEGILYFPRVDSDYGLSTRFLEFTSVSYMVRDFKNGYWFSTLDNGLYYMANRNFLTWRNFSGTRTKTITTISHLNDNTVLSGNSGGDIYLHLHEQKSKPEKIYTDNEKIVGSVSDIVQMSKEKILISGARGTILFNLKTKKYSKAITMGPPSFNSIALKKIIKNKADLHCFNYRDILIADTTNFIINDTIKNGDRIISLFYDKFTDVSYIGAVHGLYTYKNGLNDSSGKKVLNSRIEDIQMSGQRLVFATKESGVIIKSGNYYDTVDSHRGLISDICRKLKISNDTIWVLSSKGISRIIYTAPGKFNVFNLPLHAFESIAAINTFCITGTQLIFSSGPDIYFYPLHPEEKKEKFYINSFLANEKNIDLSHPIDLPYSESNIKIFFEALFYKNADKVQYRYKFAEVNDDWNYSTETSASFPSLSPGTYNFLVEARNNYGQWIPFDKKIVFTIQKPFWQKWWFIFSEILLGSIIVMRVLVLRHKKTLIKERIKHQLELHMQQLRIGLIRAQMNPHFIFNSLNTIQNFILANDNDNAYTYLSKFSKLVRKILDTSSQEYISLEDEIEILSKYIEIESLRFENTIDHEIKVSHLLNNKQIKIPQMLIQPIIENAIWHGLLHKKGDRKLTVSFSPEGERTIRCVVDDNGAGRNQKEAADAEIRKTRSISMGLIIQRLDLIHKTSGIEGKINIIDKKNSEGKALGTTVEIIIPVFQ